MPDKLKSEETFPDYVIASKAVGALRKYHSSKDLFMIAVGFKMPHLSMHVPYKYYDMYRAKADANVWELTKKERKFPKSAPAIAYRCCSDGAFKYMDNITEGATNSEKIDNLEYDYSTVTPPEMRRQLMWGYSAMITFVDKQLGRILDTIDELGMWDNLTIVLTSDHGMHNGEKGLW
jgi:arylsulfatase A-like enzyme